MERSELRLALDMRYAGQSSELGIAVSQSTLSPQILAEVVEQFHLEHERSYGYSSRTERVQLVNLRLRRGAWIGRTICRRPRLCGQEGQRRRDRKAGLFWAGTRLGQGSDLAPWRLDGRSAGGAADRGGI
jgi:N-methylhydantoinase A/oxoprolinase/acetone carboxylase beta subunit